MRSRRRAPLWLRLAVAFFVVAVAGVGLLTGLTLAATNSQVSSLSGEQQRETTASVVAAVTAAYRQAGGWTGAELESALAVSNEAGVSIAVLDQSNHRIAGAVNVQNGTGSGPGSTSDAGSGTRRTVPVTNANRRVGSVVLDFHGSGLTPALASLRTGLGQAVGIGAALAGLLAIVVALLVGRWITRPIAALTQVAGARERGDRAARVGPLKAPGELDELARAFDRMADAVGREDELRRALVADVAHELRTPISVLHASSEALVDGVVEPTPEMISSLHEEIIRLGTRVEDLQALASAEAAGLRMTVERVDLAQVAGEALAALGPRFAAAQVELHSKLETVTVWGDPARLHQIIANLLTNASKFTAPGGQTRLEVGKTPDTGQVAVCDSGPGISSDDLRHIYERFWRGNGASDTPGSGIGLAVVAELVRAHDGTIETKSELGHGSTFVVSLPRA
jgi:signal transduction histidine kinase